MDLVESDPSPPAVRYNWSWGGTVTIVTTSGARFTNTVDAPEEDQGCAASTGATSTRISCALVRDSGLSTKRIEQTLTLIHRFDEVRRVSELTHLLS